MRTFSIKTVQAALVIMLTALLNTTATAADSKKEAQPKPAYKKVTGEVLSVSPGSIVIKGRSKGPMTLAVTDKTDTIGAAPKAGDRVAVNYRVDKTGKTATRIKVLPVTAKAGNPPEAPAASAPKQH